MIKIRTIITILSICIFTFGAHQLILALDLGDTVKIEGSNMLPNLFYEHNLYDHRTEHDDIIYCLDPEKVGTEFSSYQGKVVNNLDLYSNQQIAILKSVIINGYPNILPGTPYRSFSTNEYHSITAMAIRAICMEFKGMTRGKTAEDYLSVQYGEAAAKLECIKLIVYAKNYPYNQNYNELSVKCISDNEVLSEDGTKIGKEYILEGVNVAGPINLSAIDGNNNDFILPKNLTIGQKFNIMAPKDKTYIPINKTLEIIGNSNSGLVYIKAGISSRQSYMGILKVNQDFKTTFDFNLDPNIAKLRVIKKDIDTQEILTGATFKIWSKQPENINDIDNLIGIFVTNEEGFIEINNLGKLGTYYISEIGVPIGYKSTDNAIFETVEVAKFGITYNKTIYNQQNVILENFIQISGYKQLASNQPVTYKVFGATNASSVSLNNFTISIPIPHEYYKLNTITLGEFKEKQGYLMYLIDSNNNNHEIKKSYNDEADYLLSKSSTHETRNIKGIFNSTDVKSIDVPEAGIRELTIKLSPDSKGIEFRTPIFGKGSYSIYIKNNEKEYLLGANFDAKIEHSFVCSNLRSYRIVFDKPIFIDEFKTGTFTSNDKSNEIYSVMVDTDKMDNVLIKDNLEANKINLLKFSDSEIVENISIIFKEAVKPGFSLVSPIVLTGNSKDLKHIIDNKYNGNGNDLNFSNLVFVKGEYKGNEAKNGDEWETSSYSKELKLNKGNLPKTGSYKYILIGFLSLTLGIFLVIKWRKYHE
ncbi:MAG: hypothetical protein FD141_1127 [Fusobacteria bacterium]|nr:MAG: hypothetical protein FD141_1127 [Fusobacteriota bacterium]KAF0229840.1 MAG: hypothetical protein FD182_230 [Fusobacteriota bacterium]